MNRSRTIQRRRGACWLPAILVWLALPLLGGTQGEAAGAGFHVAVFNFQMKAETPEWGWLEKGLADQITTDFSRSRRITVVARDEMQLMAAKLRWTPEMAIGSAAAMEQARKQLEIDRLITGVYTVRDGRIEIVAQVVDVKSRKELVRKVAAGPVRDVLTLQRTLSAQLLGWFSDVPPEEILPHLPVWTRSLEATRGLYEGLHLYDQGRYEEAWLKFRQAWRTDPSYLEAHYWVGRMYYFMDRYEHARRAYEAFVYMDARHPRIGDAVREYLHTYEKLDTPPETMLALYGDFIGRLGDVPVHNVLEVPGSVPVRAWLRVRTGEVLASMGRHVEAAEIASLAMQEIFDEMHTRAPGAYVAAMDGAYRHNLQTGRVLMPGGLATHFTYGEVGNHIVRFAPGRTEAFYRLPVPDPLSPLRGPDGRAYYPNAFRWHFLLAPDGYIFRKITAYPLASGDARIGSCLHKHYFGDCGSVYYTPMAKAAKEGFVFENVPPSGMFQLHFFIAANDRRRDPHVDYAGVRVVAELEKIGPHGAIDVRSPSTGCFWAYLEDGRLGRKGPGLIGLLPAGPHTLELRASPAHAASKVAVNVEPGKTARLEVPLAWDPKGPWRQWSTGALVGRNYPPRTPAQDQWGGSMAILAEPGGVRMFWSFEGDIWTASAADGRTFGPPRRLDLPVSSGWFEGHIRAFRAESGRYVLTFISDREAQHRQRPYLCWSRDGVHWSRPSMVFDHGAVYDLMQDADGQFVWADAFDDTIRLMRSREGYAWGPLGTVPLPGRFCDMRLLRRPDGLYELYVTSLRLGVQDGESHAEESERTTLWRLASRDLQAWSAPEPVAHMDIGQTTSLSAFPTPRGTVVAVFRHQTTRWGMYLWLFRQGPDGRWVRSQPQHGLGEYGGEMTWSEPWGYLLGWRSPAGSQFPAEPAGPFFLSGPSIEPLLDTKGKPIP